MLENEKYPDNLTLHALKYLFCIQRNVNYTSHKSLKYIVTRYSNSGTLATGFYWTIWLIEIGIVYFKTTFCVYHPMKRNTPPVNKSIVYHKKKIMFGAFMKLGTLIDPFLLKINRI